MEAIDNPLETPGTRKPETSSNEEFEYVEKSETEISVPKDPRRNQDQSEETPNPGELALDPESGKELESGEPVKKEETEQKEETEGNNEEVTEQTTNKGMSEEKLQEAKEKPGDKETLSSEDSGAETLVKPKKNKREKIKEILLNIFENSVYLEFLKVAQVLSFEYLKYVSPLNTKKLIRSYVILTDFGIAVLIMKEFFVRGTTWWGGSDLPAPEETGDQPKLPFRREYFLVPYLLIDEIDHDPNEHLLSISTKVQDF